MVNYGYDCVGWTADAKEELANELAKIAAKFKDQYGKTPTIEVDGTYPGVRIRKMTWLTPEQIDKLTIEADAIVDKIAERFSDEYAEAMHSLAQKDVY